MESDLLPAVKDTFFSELTELTSSFRVRTRFLEQATLLFEHVYFSSDNQTNYFSITIDTSAIKALEFTDENAFINCLWEIDLPGFEIDSDLRGYVLLVLRKMMLMPSMIY
ncbi:MAG: hypothetical protein ACXAEU_01090 [Candidatus Hodarchaeales archaeon]|jgi:hypothetical protein